MAVVTAAGKTAERSDVRRAGRRRTVPPIVLNVVALIVGVGIWAVLAALGVQGLPGPLAVGTRGVQMIGDGTLAPDAYASLRRVFTGFVLGTALAVPVGFLMGWYPVARGLLEPYVQFFRTIPPLAIIPLAIVLMGIGETP